MDILPTSVTRLIDEFAKLPSIGPKTAERLTFYLLRGKDEQNLASAIASLKNNIQRCEVCRNYSEDTICRICADPGRDKTILAIVSAPLDVVALERTSSFRGQYHVLHGVISPIDGMGPDQLEMTSLIDRLDSNLPKEIIIATNPNIEGETTALYLLKKIQPYNIKVTRLAHGLPMGGDLEYADQITLGRALDNRREF